MIEVRPLTEHADFHEAVRLQQEIWGFTDVELLPVRLFVVATKVGGQAFGAFDRQPHDRILPRDSRTQARRRILSPQPHARCAAGVSQCGRRAQAEDGAAARMRWRAESS